MERAAALMVTLALLPFAGSVGGGLGGDVKKVIEGNIVSPQIYEDTISYLEFTGGASYDVYYLKTGGISSYKDAKVIETGIKIPRNLYHISNCALIEEKILYASDWNIFVYNLSTGEEIQITGNEGLNRRDGKYNMPFLWQGKVCYTEWRRDKEKNYDVPIICSYDLGAREEKEIAEGNLGGSRSSYFGEKLVFKNGSPFVYNYTTREISPLPIADVDEYSVFGDKMVYSTADRKLYTYDMNDKTRRLLTTDLGRGLRIFGIYGENVVYCDSENRVILYSIVKNEKKVIGEMENNIHEVSMYEDEIVLTTGDGLYYIRVKGGEK